jgi:hypothetical protein
VSGQSRGAVYEVTVAGPLGPVVRRALLPCRAGRSSLDTVVRMTGRDGEEVADLVGRLESLGWEVTSISVVS